MFRDPVNGNITLFNPNMINGIEPVTLGLLLGGAGLLGGGAGAFMGNKKRAKPPEFQKYEGYRPPRVEGLRDVESMIRETLMRRSQGQDVGFAPERREQLLNAYDIQNDRALGRQKEDIINSLSGMGLSRNLKARDLLYNRTMEDNKRDRDLYTSRVDVEDLTRANDERAHNTDALQNLNTFNFGQENRAADFDLSVYNAEQGNRYRAYGAADNYAQQYQDPMSSGISSALAGFGTGFGAPVGKNGGGGAVSALMGGQRPSDTFKVSSPYQSNYADVMGGASKYLKPYRLGGM